MISAFLMSISMPMIYYNFIMAGELKFFLHYYNSDDEDDDYFNSLWYYSLPSLDIIAYYCFMSTGPLLQSFNHPKKQVLLGSIFTWIGFYIFIKY